VRQSGQLKQAQDDLEKLQEQLLQEKEGRELENKIQAFQTQYYENQITSLQSTIAAGQQTSEDLNGKLKEKDKIITNSKRQLEREKDKLTILRRQKRLGEKTLNQQVASLQRKNEAEKNKLNEKLEKLRDSKLVSEEQLNQKIGQLTEEIKNLNDTYKKEKENYDKKLTQLQTDLEQEQKSNQQSQAKINN